MSGSQYFVHESSYVDDGVEIGEGTKIWHFSHIQKGSRIGKNCSIGQNVNIGNNGNIGDNVKIQNNVSIYEGVILEDFVFCGPSMVFTNAPPSTDISVVEIVAGATGVAVKETAIVSDTVLSAAGAVMVTEGKLFTI